MPSSRMSSSTSTVRPRTLSRGATRQVDLAALVVVVVARDLDGAELEREAQQRQELPGEDRGAAHHREHQRDTRRPARWLISPASAAHRGLDLLGARRSARLLEEGPAPRCTSGHAPESSVTSGSARKSSPSLGMLSAELHRRLQVAELGAAVVAPPGQAQREHRLVAQQRPIASVSWISPPAPGRSARQEVEDARRQHVAADHRQRRRRRRPAWASRRCCGCAPGPPCILSMVTMP